MATDRSAALLKLLRGKSQQQGLYIVKVNSASPITFTFEGSNLALDKELFEIPEDFLPVTKGQRYFALPILGNYDSQRWGIIHKIDGPKTTKTFLTGDTVKKTVTVVDGRITKIE